MTLNRTWKLSLTSILAVLAAVMTTAALALVLSPPAQAHSELTGSTPAEGDSLEEAPTEVVLEYNEDIQSLGTEVVVTGPDGESVNDGDVIIDGPTVTQPISADADGTYTVTWRAVSADGHPISGEFTYDLTLPAVEETTAEETEATSEEATSEQATGAATTTDEAAAESSSPSAENISSGTDLALPIIIVVAVLAIAGVVLLVVRRKRAQ